MLSEDEIPAHGALRVAKLLDPGLVLAAGERVCPKHLNRSQDIGQPATMAKVG